MATGASDKAGCLGVPGESLSYVTHNLRHFEELLSSRKEKNCYISPGVTSFVEEGEKLSSSFLRKSQICKAKSNNYLETNESSVSPFFNSCNGSQHLNENVEGRVNGWGEENVEANTRGVNKPISKLVERMNDVPRDDLPYEFSKKQNSAKPSESAFEKGGEIWVTNDIPDENKINFSFGVLDLGSEDFANSEKEVGEEENRTVLIVGAGLSAADAILAAWRKNFSVVHAFRSPLTTTKLPAVMYPEYHEVTFFGLTA